MKPTAKPKTMKKLTLISLLAFGALGSVAQAAIYTDVHDSADIVAAGHASGFVQLDSSRPGHESYTGTFDIAAQGYVPGGQGSTIHSAYASFIFRDYLRQAGDDDEVTIDLGNALFAAASDIEFALLTVGNSLTLGLIADLSADGKLDFTITAVDGAFLFKGGSLTATVPDGAWTVSLLGMGLLGLAAVRRKLA